MYAQTGDRVAHSGQFSLWVLESGREKSYRGVVTLPIQVFAYYFYWACFVIFIIKFILISIVSYLMHVACQKKQSYKIQCVRFLLLLKGMTEQCFCYRMNRSWVTKTGAGNTFCAYMFERLPV